MTFVRNFIIIKHKSRPGCVKAGLSVDIQKRKKYIQKGLVSRFSGLCLSLL